MVTQEHENSAVSLVGRIASPCHQVIGLIHFAVQLWQKPVRDQRSLLPEANGFANSPGATMDQLESQADITY